MPRDIDLNKPFPDGYLEEVKKEDKDLENLSDAVKIQIALYQTNAEDIKGDMQDGTADSIKYIRNILGVLGTPDKLEDAKLNDEERKSYKELVSITKRYLLTRLSENQIFFGNGLNHEEADEIVGFVQIAEAIISDLDFLKDNFFLDANEIKFLEERRAEVTAVKNKYGLDE